MPRAGAGEEAGRLEDEEEEDDGRNQRVLVSSVEQGQQASRAVTVCGQVLKSDPENVNALKGRAEAYVQEEQYEEGELHVGSPAGRSSLNQSYCDIG